MLVIRMQRTGRKGHAMFRVVVQDSRRTPSSGKVVAALGSYDPHTKATTLDKEKAATYMNNGAQPSPRVVRLLQSEGVKLPDWVKVSVPKESAVKNPEKRRSTSPAPEVEEVVEEAPVEAPAEAEAPAEEPAEAAEEAPEAEAEAEAPAEA
jgi:small subunit ribosomal protein S16